VAKRSIARMRADGAIIPDILNLIGRFFKFGMETKAGGRHIYHLT
jgi:hypothetical protein